MAIESDELVRQLPASLALPYSLLNYRNARLKTVMLCLISCAYQDRFALHIPYYLLPENRSTYACFLNSNVGFFLSITQV